MPDGLTDRTSAGAPHGPPRPSWPHATVAAALLTGALAAVVAYQALWVLSLR